MNPHSSENEHSPLTLRGPRHLMSCLAELGIDSRKKGHYFIALNEEHQVGAVFNDIGLCAGYSNAIAVIVEDDDAIAHPDTFLSHSLTPPADVHLLDALVITDQRWKSLMCKDLSCCPETGTRLTTHGPSTPRRRALHAQWEAWLAIGSVPHHQQASALSTLEDLALRDALLAGLAHSPETLAQWLRISHDLTPEPTPPLLSLLASVYFLLQEREKCQEMLTKALEIEPGYSLARLLQQAIASDAPQNIVLSAFAKYSPNELLERATNDIEERLFLTATAS